jgi:hypothetical protein
MSSIAAHWGLDNILWLEAVGDTQAFGFTHRGKPYLVFRGSESLQDWLVDGLAAPLPMSMQNGADSCLVHGGFCAAFGQFMAVHTMALCDLAPLRDFTVYGHSLGGALATLFNLKHGATAITYGAPRVVLDFDGPEPEGLTRVTRGYDVVTHLPPLYQHYGLTVHIHDYQDPVRDHFIRYYIQGLAHDQQFD